MARGESEGVSILDATLALPSALLVSSLGRPSILRSVQDLAADAPNRVRKAEFLAIVFAENLALQRRVDEGPNR